MAILLVDDEVHALRAYEAQFLAEGLGETRSAASGAEALRAIGEGGVELMLLDLRMTGMQGEEVLAEALRMRPGLPVIVITAVNEAETAVRCIAAGAYDYLVKPVDPARLMTSVRKALEFSELRDENEALAETLRDGGVRAPEAFAPILTRDARMRALFRYVDSISRSSQPVLVSGETGVGKELFARAIHAASGRKGELVSVNIAGLDEESFADSLFGHKRGAFTGADRERAGLIERAEEGTLFLDEIGELGERGQVRLLRLLQEREYYPLGSDLPRRSSARVVAATNRDLAAAAKDGSFRPDLFYRLQLHQVRIPPLRERRGDIPALAGVFLREAEEELGIEAPDLPQAFEDDLLRYDFPGNVRELRALVFEAASRLSSGVDSLASLLPPAAGGAQTDAEGRDARPEMAWDAAAGGLFSSLESLPTLEEVEDLLIAEAMRRTGGNRTLAADLVGVARQTLIRRAKRRDDEAQ